MLKINNMKELKEHLKIYLKDNKTTEITYDQLHSIYRDIYPREILGSLLTNFIQKLLQREEIEIKNDKKKIYSLKPSFFTNTEVNKQLRRKITRSLFQRGQ